MFYFDFVGFTMFLDFLTQLILQAEEMVDLTCIHTLLIADLVSCAPTLSLGTSPRARSFMFETA